MTFVPFKRFGASSRTSLTLRTSGLLFISYKILDNFNASNAEAAIIMYDDEIPKIAIKFLEKFDGAAECRKILKEKSGVILNITAVLRHYGINGIKEKINFLVKEEDNLLIIDLRKLCLK